MDLSVFLLPIPREDGTVDELVFRLIRVVYRQVSLGQSRLCGTYRGVIKRQSQEVDGQIRDVFEREPKRRSAKKNKI